MLLRVGIHGCRNCIYDRKIYDSVVELLMKLAQFWYFGYVSKSLVAKSTTAMNPNPDRQLHRRRRRLQPARPPRVRLVPPVHAPQPALRTQAVPMELQVRTNEEKLLEKPNHCSF